jgi:hypothetical protein
MIGANCNLKLQGGLWNPRKTADFSFHFGGFMPLKGS